MHDFRPVEECLLLNYCYAGWMDLGDRVAGHAENKALKMWLARQAQAGS